MGLCPEWSLLTFGEGPDKIYNINSVSLWKKKKSHIQVAGIIEGVKFVAGPSDNLALVDLNVFYLTVFH